MNNKNHEKNNNEVIDEMLQEIHKVIDPEKDKYGVKLIENAKKLGKKLKDNEMTTSNIRKLYSEAKKINPDVDTNWPYKVNMLKARFAYAAGKNPKKVKDFQKVAEKALESIGNDPLKYYRFLDFFEAVVAYHRAYGGKE